MRHALTKGQAKTVVDPKNGRGLDGEKKKRLVLLVLECVDQESITSAR
jgi:hypothetical protein